MARYQNTKKRKKNKKQHYGTTIYKVIPERNTDIYLIAQQGDRCDNLAFKFYGNSNPDLKPNNGETAEEFKQRGGIPGKYMGNADTGFIYRVIDGVGVFTNVLEEQELENL